MITQADLLAEINRRRQRRDPRPLPPRVDGCFICGTEGATPIGRPRRSQIPAASLGLGTGWLSVELCRDCRKVADRFGDPDQNALAGHEPVWLAVTRVRLDAIKPDWRSEPISLRHLPALIWAGRVLAHPEAKPPTKPFGWHRRKFDKLDFPPPPPPPPVKPVDLRRVESGCLSCGQRTNSNSLAIAYSAEAFGLSGRGRVTGRLCGACEGLYGAYRELFFEDEPQTPATIAATVTQRLRMTRPDALPSGFLRSETIKPLSITEWCWAGLVIQAREAGRNEPEPGEAFAWLEG